MLIMKGASVEGLAVVCEQVDQAQCHEGGSTEARFRRRRLRCARHAFEKHGVRQCAQSRCWLGHRPPLAVIQGCQGRLQDSDSIRTGEGSHVTVGTVALFAGPCGEPGNNGFDRGLQWLAATRVSVATFVCVERRGSADSRPLAEYDRGGSLIPGPNRLLSCTSAWS